MFLANDTVLAFHGPLIYQAKVLKTHRANDDFVVTGDNKTEPLASTAKFPKDMASVDAYFLHYQGWNSKWDEWVTELRILEDNEENRNRKRDLEQITKKKRTAKKQEPPAKKSEKPEKEKKVDRPVKKRKINVVSLDFSNALKYVLIDDWEFVTKSKKLVDLPAKVPVSRILDDYASERLPQLDKEPRAVCKEIISELKEYFNQLLSVLLLYKVENLQYFNLLKDHTVTESTKGDVYGVEHLLRLLVSMPSLVGQTNMDGPSVNVLMAEVSRILEWIATRVSEYRNEYVHTSPQYDGLSRI